MTLSVLIVGGGICGLATAVACKQADASVRVLEAAPRLDPQGTAISVWPNGLKCLASWGLSDRVSRLGYPFDRIATRHMDGAPIFSFDLTDLHSKHGQHSRCISRAQLHDLLSTALAPETIVLGAQATSVDSGDDNATVTLADGSTQSADLVVVADGQNSALRGQVVGESALRPAVYGAVLGLASGWVSPPGWGDAHEACEYYGPNGRFGVFRSGEDQAYWFFVSTAVPDAHHAEPADPAWVLSQLADWPAPFKKMVTQTPADRMPRVSFNDRRPAPHWGLGRVVLAGDAAHPMLPNFGQGANQAFEDAHAIGTGLERGLRGADLATFYTDTRKRRAEMFVKQSRQNGTLTQQEHRFGQWMRNTMMRLVPKRSISEQLDSHFSGPSL